MASNHLLPASAMRLPGFANKKDNREIIIDHLVTEQGAVKLTDQQQELLNRWHAADDLMRSLNYSSKEIVNMLCKKFDYASATAYRDMEDAKFVFGTTRKANKPYLLALHLDRLEAAIVLAQRQGRRDAKLYDAYTNALKLLPNDAAKKEAPTAIVFSFTQNNFGDLAPDASMTHTDAVAIAADRLVKLGIDIEDIFHEEVADD